MNLLAALTILCSSSLLQLSEDVTRQTCGENSACLGFVRIYERKSGKCTEVVQPGMRQADIGDFCAIAGGLGEKSEVEKATLDRACQIRK